MFLLCDLWVQVAKEIIDGKELEFYKWDGELSELLSAVKVNLNKVAEVSPTTHSGEWSLLDDCTHNTFRELSSKSVVMELM